jgi:hypothetical protein
MCEIKIFRIELALLLLAIILSACGPSPEELVATSAAETAAAATSTPTITPTSTSTPTPTPIPYDLSVLVTGEDSAPIEGAKVYLEEFDDTGNTDEEGLSVWSNLPGDTFTLNVSAQGYFSVELPGKIERGENLVVVPLERDPYGMLPSDGCLPGEKLLYIEDFQDQLAQDWMEIAYGAQDWEIISHPDDPGNYVVSRLSNYEANSELKQDFDNAVWRFKIMHSGSNPVSSFAWHWHVDQAGGWSAYTTYIHNTMSQTYRVIDPDSHLKLRWVDNVIKKDVWQQIEISSYDGRFEFWVEGIPWIQYDDPEQLPSGGITIGVGLGSDLENTSRVYFDDFVVCQLSSPVEPWPTPETD